MRLSTSIEYAIHGLVFLAKTSNDKKILIAEIARAKGVPDAYLRKVFQKLLLSGIVTF